MAKVFGSKPIEITDIELLPFDRELVLEFSLDTPVVGSTSDALSLDISGWALGVGRKILSIEVSSHGQPLRLIPVNIPREDVQTIYPVQPHALSSGFAGQMGILGAPRDFNLVLNAVLRGEGKDERIRVPVAAIKGRHQLGEHLPAKRQPLMLTGIGRSGTTWMMRLLSAHPELVTIEQHPYEVRPAVYWMHLLKVLTDPADHARSTIPDGFENFVQSIGQNPYNHPRYFEPFAEPAKIREAFGVNYLSEVENLCKRSVETVYDAVAADQGKSDVKYFAEKQLPSHVQSIFWEMYEDPREIILVRDFRDVLCSARAFNEKRNIVAFGRERAKDEEEWIRNMANRGVRRLLNAWQERSSRAYLLHYEDLILRPKETLISVFEYLGIDSSDKAVNKIIKTTSIDNNDAKGHRTSQDPKKSVGRWRTELDPRLKEIAKEAMGEVLSELGYDLE